MTADIDAIRWHARARVDKYSEDQVAWARLRLGHEPDGAELATLFVAPGDGTAEADGNLLVTVGLDAITKLLINTGSPQAFSGPTRAIVGVGASSTAANIADTALGADGGSAWYQGCDSANPTQANGVITTVCTFATGNANFAWNEWCVRSEAEIMTRAGWKRHGQLLVGEDVLTLDQVTRTSRWQPLLDVHVWVARPRRMRVFDSARGIRVAVTADHRWPVLGGRRKDLVTWRTSETLPGQGMIIRAVPHSGFPETAKYSDAVVRLVAHYWCDGWVRDRGRPSLQGGIGVKRPDKVASVRSALQALPPGSWGENAKSGEAICFRLNKDALDVLGPLAPGKVPSYAFLSDLTEAQLRMFVDICVELGDGGDGSGGRYFIQTRKHGDGPGRMEYACALLGIATNTYDKPAVGRFGTEPVYRTTLLQAETSIVGTSDQGWDEVEDIVWCPQTPDTTWLCRDRGSVFWTGNCWATCTGSITPGATLAGVATGTKMWNHKIQSLGTKVSGSWVLTSTITIS